MEPLFVRIVSILAFPVVLATDVLYVVLINAQGQSAQPYIARFVGGYLAVMAALIAVALVPRPETARIRVALRAAAAGGLLLMGFLAAFTIGAPLVVAGFLVFFALTRTVRENRSTPARLSGLVAAALAVVVLLAGLEVTQRFIVCPEQSQETGGGSGLITGPYQYECNNGVAHFHSG